MRKKNFAINFLLNSFEWYDYAVFIQLMPWITKNLFPTDIRSLSYAFLLFALGYVARPFGGVFLGLVGDKLGRKFALVICILCISVPTFLIGVLPSYHQIGITSFVLLFICRLFQGFSIGGTVANAISFSVEHDKKNAGLVGSIPMASIPLGIFIGSVVLFILKKLLTLEQFEQWGWRVPFLLGFFIAFVALYLHIVVSETPEFVALAKFNLVLNNPLKKTFLKYYHVLLLSICINALGSVIFYCNTVYVITYLSNTKGWDAVITNYLAMFCSFIMVFIALISGALSDKVGMFKLYLGLIITIVISIFFILYYVEYGVLIEVILAQVVLGVLSAAYIGPEPALQASLYPPDIRTTSLAISYNVATCFFGGLTPYILNFIVNKFSFLYVGIYVILSAILSFVALIFIRSLKKFS